MPFLNRAFTAILAVTVYALAFFLVSGSAAPAAAAGTAGPGKATVSVSVAKASRTVTVRVRFAGTPPRDVTVSARMTMRDEMHVVNRIVLHRTSDPHVLETHVALSMGGAWTIEVRYDKNRVIDVPIKV